MLAERSPRGPLLVLAAVLAALVMLGSLPAAGLAARDKVTGTFTVHGKTVTFHEVYASLDKDPEDPSEQVLVLLLSDVQLEPADRGRERLAELARSGKVHALALRWSYGSDYVTSTPYHKDLAASGMPTHGNNVLDLEAFDDKNVTAMVRSKMLGQEWFYSARVQAAVAQGGVAEAEPQAVEWQGAEAEEATAEAPAEAAPGDPAAQRRIKLRLGALGYDYTEESFTQAIKDANAEAVGLFLKAGMSPDAKDASGNHVMLLAAMFCAYPPPEGRTAVALALIAAKSPVNVYDQNHSSPLLWAVQSCDPKVIQALLAAGADPNAQAKGSATPLMMAEVYGRADVVALLKKAGATKK